MTVRLLNGDCRERLRELDAGSVHACVTSPPYFGLRDYGHDGQIGLEDTPDAFVAQMVDVFREVRRVLRDDGTLWLNLGDSYASSTKGSGGTGKSTLGPASGGNGISDAGILRSQERQAMGVRTVDCGLPDKNLLGIPWRVAFALQADGWYLRQDIIWSKPNPMPESVRDRCTKSHEYVFLLSKGPRYYYDAEAIAEPVADTSLARWAQSGLDEQTGSSRVPGKTNGAMKAVGGAARPQARRAVEIAREKGLTDAHLAAIRSVGITDAGKAQITQDGHGNNDPAVQALADEAKAALGGYYREFLIAENRNKRSVWNVPTQPYSGAHFATYPPELIEPCVLAGCPKGGTVLDPFGGAGTTGLVADRLQRNAVLVELNPEYAEIARKRLQGDGGMFSDVEAA